MGLPRENLVKRGKGSAISTVVPKRRIACTKKAARSARERHCAQCGPELRSQVRVSGYRRGTAQGRAEIGELSDAQRRGRQETERHDEGDSERQQDRVGTAERGMGKA